MNDFKGLVKFDVYGNFYVPSIEMIEMPNELYCCIEKLKDYEKCNIQPSELEDLVTEILYSDNPKSIDVTRYANILKYRKTNK